VRVTNHGDQGLSERAVRTVIVIEFVVIDDDGHVRTADQFGILVAARNLNRTVSSNSYSISQLEAQRGFPDCNLKVSWIFSCPFRDKRLRFHGTLQVANAAAHSSLQDWAYDK
jgi:hypothetical protein